MTRFSVIIATYNRCALLRRTLPTVLGQDFPRNQFEVIVAVDGSNDGTVEFLESVRDPRLRFVRQDNRGQAFAINLGLKNAQGDIVVFLDDDLICDSQLLQNYDAAHRQTLNSIVFGPVFTSDESPNTVAARLRREGMSAFSTMRDESVQFRFAAGSGNTSVAREAVLAVGGMNEAFVGARDEAELGVRLWLTGLRFKYCRDARTDEIYMNSSDDVVRNMLVHGKNELRLCREYDVYREHSILQSLRKSPRKAQFLSLITKFRFLTDPLFAMCEMISNYVGLSEAASGILARRASLAFYSSALKEARGPNALLSIMEASESSSGSPNEGTRYKPR